MLSANSVNSSFVGELTRPQQHSANPANLNTSNFSAQQPESQLTLPSLSNQVNVATKGQITSNTGLNEKITCLTQKKRSSANR